MAAILFSGAIHRSWPHRHCSQKYSRTCWHPQISENLQKPYFEVCDPGIIVRAAHLIAIILELFSNFCIAITLLIYNRMSCNLDTVCNIYISKILQDVIEMHAGIWILWTYFTMYVFQFLAKNGKILNLEEFFNIKNRKILLKSVSILRTIYSAFIWYQTLKKTTFLYWLMCESSQHSDFMAAILKNGRHIFCCVIRKSWPPRQCSQKYSGCVDTLKFVTVAKSRILRFATGV